MTLQQVLALLRKECDKAGSQKAWASAHGVTGAYVSDVLKGNRDPGESILNALGLELVKDYRRIKG
jgi:hypothetical protein